MWKGESKTDISIFEARSLLDLAREQNQLTELSHANLHCGLNYFIT